MSTTTQLDPGTEIGRCPACGLVTDDDIDGAFPMEVTCARCGASLEDMTVLTEPKTVRTELLAS